LYPEADGEAAQVPGGGSWAAYPLADHLEHGRSPWENAAGQIDQSESNWNESASWPDTTRSSPPDRRLPGDARTSKKRAGKLRTPPDASDRRGSGRSASDRGASHGGAGEVEVGKVRLLRILAVGGGLIAIGIVLNLIATFFADGPGSALRWLVPPMIALVAAMALAVRDAVGPKDRAPTRLDVSIIVGIVAVLLGVGIGGFALTAGAEYVGGYLSGNESGEDRLIKPVANTTSGLTVTVDNVTYTSHFTRVELTVANAGTQAVKLPLDSSTTFTGAEGQALHADDGRSEWPGNFPTKRSEHGTILFKGRLPDAATTATLTLKSASTTFTVPRILLTN
jgi:hypothetical protein